MSVERQLMMCAGGATQQYTISNSLRFRASASAYLSRTPASAGNRQTWTWSGWVKRGQIGVTYAPIFAAGSSGSAYSAIWFHNDVLEIYSYNGATQYFLGSTQVFRDPSAWYHIVISVDTTQATASNRIKLYVNGNQVTSFSSATYPSQNYSDYVDSTAPHYFGQFTPALGGYYFDGYLTEVNFIDGQALTPSSFGETSSTTGVWIPKKYTGAYGTNGFYLSFNNNTSTTALGYDTSGNGNNWTPNNISLTTGSTYDSMIDSPTSYASGTNNVGNYCVMNPLWTDNVSYKNTLTNGNLNITIVGQSGGSLASSISSMPLQGFVYFEATVVAMSYAGSFGAWVGVSVGGSETNSLSVMAIYTGAGVSSGLQNVTSGSYNTLSAFNPAAGDVYGFAVDVSTGKTWIRINSASWFSGDPTTGSSPSKTFTANLSNLYAFADGRENSNQYAFNFGQRPFAYTPPSGYNALNTYNLSTPSIVDGSKQMAATTYTGTGASLSVSGANFTPDLVWIKSRSAATDHALYDVIRGTQARLESNTTDAEVTSDNGVTAFNSTGFTVGTLAQVNTSSATYIGWQWKANGSGVSNTDGTITSTVSANQTAGFSVVTYTGTGANATVGHGLGVAPSMIIIKIRSAAYDWVVGHSSIGWGNALNLNNTIASTAYAIGFNSTAPTSSVFSVGTAVPTNGNGSTFVAYCFAAIPGYSAFGSYTGNGSTDGAFIYTGFLPKLILVKCSSTTGNWFMLDTARNTYNVIGEQLEPNLSNAGSTVTTLDVLSNGFKMRTASDPNASQTYIYAAWASNPFKTSLAF